MASNIYQYKYNCCTIQPDLINVKNKFYHITISDTPGGGGGGIIEDGKEEEKADGW